MAPGWRLVGAAPNLPSPSGSPFILLMCGRHRLKTTTEQRGLASLAAACGSAPPFLVFLLAPAGTGTHLPVTS